MNAPARFTPAETARAKLRTPHASYTSAECRDMARGAGTNHPLMTRTDDDVAEALYRMINAGRPSVVERFLIDGEVL